MGALDALLGKILNAGTELDLEGGLNFTDGLEATRNQAQRRIDVGIAGVQVQGIGHVILTSSATTALTVNVWATIAGTFALGGQSDSLFTLGASGAKIVYAGTTACRVLAIATMSVDPAGANNTYAIRFTVDGVASDEHCHSSPANTLDAAIPLVDLLSVTPGDAIELQIANHIDSDDVDLTHGSIVYVALSPKF